MFHHSSDGKQITINVDSFYAMVYLDEKWSQDADFDVSVKVYRVETTFTSKNK